MGVFKTFDNLCQMKQHSCRHGKMYKFAMEQECTIGKYGLYPLLIGYF